MKKILLILILILNSFVLSGQYYGGYHPLETMPTEPSDPYISGLIRSSGADTTKSIDQIKATSVRQAKIFWKIGLAFQERGQQEIADWYFRISDGYDITGGDVVEVSIPGEVAEAESLKQEDVAQIEADNKLLESIPDFQTLDGPELEKAAVFIDQQIEILSRQRDSLLAAKANKKVIESKTGTLTIFEKEKEILGLNGEKIELKSLNKKYKLWLWALLGGLLFLLLLLLILLQRRTIKGKDDEITRQLEAINTKNSYLEYSAKLIRHDMHSGINTYMPRGIGSLEKILSTQQIKDLKLTSPIRMLKEGLSHTQRAWRSVFEFTNLVKSDVILEKESCDLQKTLVEFLKTTSYEKQVEVEKLPELEINKNLFCIAIDNLIKNGLKYNFSDDREVKIYQEGENIILRDNGVGMSQQEFDSNMADHTSQSGLGLKISRAILREHGFDLKCRKLEKGGTEMVIILKVT